MITRLGKISRCENIRRKTKGKTGERWKKIAYTGLWNDRGLQRERKTTIGKWRISRRFF